METPLRKPKIKELTPELHARRLKLTYRRLARHDDESDLVLLDPKIYQRDGDIDGDNAIKNMQDLLQMLSSVAGENNMGQLLLKARGRYGNEQQEQLYCVLCAPPGCTPDHRIVTLQEYLALPFRPSLTERLALAVSLARKILFIHRQSFYHKGIQSNNVIFFRRDFQQRSLTEPWLVGFDHSRRASAAAWSEKYGETYACTTCMYLHPATIENPRISFSPKFDYYAFGVLLIEIALWEPMKTILSSFQGFGDDSCSDSAAIQVQSILLNDFPEQERDFLRDVAFHAGDLYTRVVELCIRQNFPRPENDKTLIDAFEGAVNQLQTFV